MKKLLLKYAPYSLQQKWFYIKNPGMVDEGDIAFRLLSKGDAGKVMFDVGAHFGHSLEPFARKGWKIFAFEPDPNNRRKLVASTQRFPKVQIEPIALSDKEAEDMTFFASGVSTGISSLLSFHQTHQEVAKVKVTTLANYCRQHGIRHISYLKTDTEGYDLPVLRGFDWGQPHPRVILCEFDDFKTKNLNYTLQDQAKLLLDNNYKILVSEWHPIEEYGKKHRWRRFTTDPSIVRGERVWGNILAVKDSDWAALATIASKFGKIES